MRLRFIVTRLVPLVALAGIVVAFVVAMTDVSDARRRMPGASTKPRPYGILRLNRRKQFPASVVSRRLVRDLTQNCNAESIDLGTFCVGSSTIQLKPEEAGRNNYFFATQRCAELGGYLPSAAQLIGAASRAKLASTIDDSPLTASIDEDPSDGRRDRREMSATLVTTQAGSSAAGSQGVTEGSSGDARAGEPDPAPEPANPSPETLQYVTVYDNRERGGFAGAKPVSQPEQFRCAFNKAQGEQFAAE